MRSMNVLFSLVLAAPLAAQDFAPLAQASRNVYPAKQHFGVVCDYSWSREAVQNLATAVGPDARITVVDMRFADQAGRARTALQASGAEVLVLMPQDRLVRDGSFQATFFARSLGASIPTLGTKRAAMDNGAALAIGEDTHFELMVGNQLRGIIGPVQGGGTSGMAALRMAPIEVVGLAR
ncbi:MAG TPA: hypothetical protein VJ623_14990 [Holophagaceae bacterium]|nr:hypothetical protein [Holophagaceae bacterium]